MMTDQEFFTFREYMKNEESPLTASNEDYLEMIYRLSQKDGFTRIQDLAAALNVQPPSATKMVQKLADLYLVNYKKYGIILLNDEGKKKGRALLERHRTVEEFLLMLGLSKGTLEETEKIEHTIGPETLSCIAAFVSFLKSRPDIVGAYKKYLAAKKDP